MISFIFIKDIRKFDSSQISSPTGTGIIRSRSTYISENTQGFPYKRYQYDEKEYVFVDKNNIDNSDNSDLKWFQNLWQNSLQILSPVKSEDFRPSPQELQNHNLNLDEQGENQEGLTAQLYIYTNENEHTQLNPISILAQKPADFQKFIVQVYKEFCIAAHNLTKQKFSVKQLDFSNKNQKAIGKFPNKNQRPIGKQRIKRLGMKVFKEYIKSDKFSQDGYKTFITNNKQKSTTSSVEALLVLCLFIYLRCVRFPAEKQSIIQNFIDLSKKYFEGLQKTFLKIKANQKSQNRMQKHEKQIDVSIKMLYTIVLQQDLSKGISILLKFYSSSHRYQYTSRYAQKFIKLVDLLNQYIGYELPKENLMIDKKPIQSYKKNEQVNQVHQNEENNRFETLIKFINDRLVCDSRQTNKQN